MAQADYVVSNGTGAAVRADLNGQLAAIVTNNSGATSPATTYAYQWWADTTTNTLKLRNSANSAWIEIMQLDGTLTMEDGTAALPGLAFRDDLDTGIFRAGTNQLGISSAGVERVEFGSGEVVFNDSGANYDFRVEGDTNANLLFVDASADAVGIGTSLPATKIQIQHADVTASVFRLSRDGDNATTFDIDYNTASGNVTLGPTLSGIAAGFNLGFKVAGSTRMQIDGSGRVGIGTTSPSDLLHLYQNAADNIIAKLENAQGFNGNLLQFVHGSAGVHNAYIGHGGDATGNLIILNAANTATTFSTNNTERARIDSSGRLLVGTSSTVDSASNALLQSSASGGAFLALGNPNTVGAGAATLGQVGFYGYQGAYALGASITANADSTWSSNDYPTRLVFSVTKDGASSPTERMKIDNAGTFTFFNDFVYNFRTALAASASEPGIDLTHSATNMGSGTLSFRVFTNGNVVNTNNSYGAISDIKLKENIIDAGSQWADLKALQVRKYNFKEGQTHTQIGLIAQEVELVSPGLVTESPDRDAEGNDLGTVTKSVNYSVLYMKAVKALQEAMERIETLEARLDAANL